MFFELYVRCVGGVTHTAAQIKLIAMLASGLCTLFVLVYFIMLPNNTAQQITSPTTTTFQLLETYASFLPVFIVPFRYSTVLMGNATGQ